MLNKEKVLDEFMDIMSDLDKMPDGQVNWSIFQEFGIFARKVPNRDRIPRFIIIGNTDFREMLEREFEQPDMYGETMVLLFKYLLQHEDETWIFDTDAMIWDVRFGHLRDMGEVWDLDLGPDIHIADLQTEAISDVQIEDRGELVIFLKVALHDWIS